MTNNQLNLILTGMPGCGKSLIGKRAAELLDRKFIDLDALIVAKAEMSIAEIFRQFGEAHFRRMEWEAAATAAGNTAVVIATGGGTIIQREAPELFRRNGRICYLRRPLEFLETANGRPLSADRETVKKLFSARRNRYESTCDFAVENDGEAEETARRVVAAFLDASLKN